MLSNVAKYARSRSVLPGYVTASLALAVAGDFAVVESAHNANGRTLL